jgi:hypothetical protein
VIIKPTYLLSAIAIAVLATSALSANAQTQTTVRAKSTLAAIDSEAGDRVILAPIEYTNTRLPSASATVASISNDQGVAPSSGTRSAALLAASLSGAARIVEAPTRDVSKSTPAKAVASSKSEVRVASYVNAGAGMSPSTSVRNIKTNYGENQSVRISQDFTNMIVTPFEKPNLVGRDGYEVGQNGSTLLVTATGDKAFWVSISDSANPMATPISLTMVPDRNMASQTIIIQNDQPSDTALNRSGEGVAADYVQMLRDTLKDIAQQKVPRGFSVRPLTSNLSMANGFKSVPIELYSGSRIDVQRYRLTNTGVGAQVLAEEAFGQDESVMAVSIFPNISVAPGQTTDVLIVTSKAR